MLEPHVEAARDFYGAAAGRYVEFVGTEITEATEGPLDRSMLVTFVELVSEAGGSQVADVGCGPGRAAAFLAARGLHPVGVDISPELLALARGAHPDLQFEEGRLTALPFEDRTLAGAVCWYSIIYTSPSHLGVAFIELARVLDAAGYLLLAFQAGGGETVEQGKSLDLDTTVTAFRHSPDVVTQALEEAGFEIYATALRALPLEHESSPQAFVIARVRAPVEV
jgi:ubiquinone/menaquinone biosynthesis C-methylase UbiE